MGKSKKQVSVVAQPADNGVKKKGKRGLEKESGAKPSKKIKVAGKSKETEEEIEMVEAEEPTEHLLKASAKVGALSVKDGSGKKNKKAGSKVKSAVLKTAPSKNGKKAPKEESEEDDSDSDEEPAKPPSKANTKAGADSKGVNVKSSKKVTKQESSSEDDDSDDDSSDNDEVPVKPVSKQKPQPVSTVAMKNGKPSSKKESSSDDDSSESEDEPETLPAKALAKPPPKQTQSSSKEEDSDDSDEEEEPKQKMKAAAVVKSNAKVPAKKLESSDEEEGSDDSEELDAEEEKLMSKSAASDDSDSSEDDEDEEEDDEVEEKTKVAKKEQLVKPKTPAPIAEGGGSKTVFVKNLAWSVDEDSVQEFFESAGEVLEVRLARNPDGQFRGFGHVDFASEEGAKKACEKSGEMLGGRDVFVDLARERPASDGKRDFKSPRGGGFSGSGGQRSSSDATAFVRGFDKFQDEDSIRSSLTDFFGDCGVQNIRLPTDRETGDIKGFAYVDFNDKAALSKAIEYNGSDLNGRSLYVEEAGGGPGSGGGGRGRGRGGDFGGRGRGGDFGGRGGRGRGSFGDGGRGGGRGGGRRGGRGFGGSREKAGLFGAGKKTTFGDD